MTRRTQAARAVLANMAEGAPRCQKCGMPMARRTIRKGERAGRQFWGCPKYFTTGCDFTIEIR